MKNNRKIRIAVIFGGRSGEFAVSLMSASSVLGALDRERYEVTEVAIHPDGAWYVGENVLDAMASLNMTGLSPVTILPDPSRAGLYALRPEQGRTRLSYLGGLDVVFPVLHGTFGEDGSLQGLLELAGLPYVGAGVLGSAVGMDKGVFKDVMKARGLPVVESMIIRRSEWSSQPDSWLDAAERLGPYPLFVKPANLGSSVGVSKCASRSDLYEGIFHAGRFDRRILVERGLDAREIEVSVLGNDSAEASIPGEIVPAGEFYTYDAKYHDQASKLLIPAPIPDDLGRQVRRLAVEAYRAIDCAGLARVDFLLERETDKLYLNELNTIPGFTNISMYAKLWEASGLAYTDLVDRLIELALERKGERDQTQFSYRRSG